MSRMNNMADADEKRNDELLSSPKRTRHPINKCISFEILMKILTMMVHQYLVWISPSAIIAAILLGMDLQRELRCFGVMALQTLCTIFLFHPSMWPALFFADDLLSSKNFQLGLGVGCSLAIPTI